VPALLTSSNTPAPVAQGIEHRPPEAVAQVRILPGALSKSAGQRAFLAEGSVTIPRSSWPRYTLGTQEFERSTRSAVDPPRRIAPPAHSRGSLSTLHGHGSPLTLNQRVGGSSPSRRTTSDLPIHRRDAHGDLSGSRSRANFGFKRLCSNGCARVQRSFSRRLARSWACSATASRLERQAEHSV
jgi:hypothetical protein